ncbi:elongator complex protein 3 [Desulfococcus sp.]|uniref:elongator complex protein 3 n=1 Tax=Desulfococcus sp. TaxID=2025834 RepID=UPI0035938A2C
MTSSATKTAGIQKPFIIPVFIPHAGCPHRCVFCSQEDITRQGGGPYPSEAVRARIDAFLKFKGPGRGEVQVSFYGGNFLGLEPAEILRLLAGADRFVRSGAVDGIRFSTRPDTITPDRLDLLSEFPVAVVELGAQSMDDGVLAEARRGHTAADTRAAVLRLKSRGLSVGLQMMAGLPGDTPEKTCGTAREIADLSPDFVRIYPTLVLKNSLLAAWHRQGRYAPLSLEDAVALVARLHAFFVRKGIPVIRMGLQASESLNDAGTVVAGPYHPAFGHLVYSRQFLSCASKLLENEAAGSSPVVIQVHPRNISRMRGLGNKNIEILKKMFHIDRIAVIPNPAVSMTAVRVNRTGDIYSGPFDK